MSGSSSIPVLTGLEPIDSALGGLEPGRPHVVYGAVGAGKTTLALQFVAEGLRGGQVCLLVVRYPAPEAIRTLEALGCDCREDLRSGRLVLFEHASDLVDQLTRQDDYNEILAELDWLIDGLSPDRIVFDTADYVFAIQHGYGYSLQVPALINWVSSRDALALLVVEERVGDRIVQAFRANARTVIHAVRRSVGVDFEYFLAFEKGAAKASPRRVRLGEVGVETADVVDVGVPARPTAPLRLPTAPLRMPTDQDPRTGRIFATEDTEKLVAEAASGVAAQPARKLAQAEPLARSGRPRVLVIDDDAFTFRLVERALGAEYQTEAVYDGIGGLAKLVSFDPDLVVLDITLPFVDGFTVCRQIRSRSSVPIMMVSGTRTGASDRIASMEVGADCFLPKPFSLHEVALWVRQLVGRYRHELAPPAAGAEADQLVPFKRFVERVEVLADVLGPDGQSTLLGCPLRTSGLSETGRVVDLVRSTVRPEDLVSIDFESLHLVILTGSPEDAARTLATRLATEIQEQVGANLEFWTIPIARVAGDVAGGLAARFRQVESASADGWMRPDFLEYLR
jgi:CheY-like chemotaxis protein/KaiC/GvpD/RAD55 family RecA-like ATPase